MYNLNLKNYNQIKFYLILLSLYLLKFAKLKYKIKKNYSKLC